MSSASMTSNKREKDAPELQQELEALRAMNSCLQTYLDHLRTFKSNLTSTKDNCTQLANVNSQWINALNR